MKKTNKNDKNKAKLYKTGLRLDTPRPQVFEDKRKKKRSQEKIALRKNWEA